MNSPLTTLMRSMAMGEKRQGLKLALPKEMPSRMGYMDAAAPESLAGPRRRIGNGKSRCND